MAGRPRIPAVIKAARGDTHRVGAKIFAESLGQSLIATRGRPEDPEDFEPQQLPKEFRDNPEAVARHRATEGRRRRAKKHYEYLCRVLTRENLLCMADQGILVGMAWIHALRTDAAERGASKECAALDDAYRSGTNLTGLNEVARTKIPKPNTEKQMSAADAALAAGLPDEDQPVQ